MIDNKYILETVGIGKSFNGVQVLGDINLRFEYGKVHALLGENGAGKSTLIKIVSGSYQPSEGMIKFEGKEQFHLTPRGAIKAGIAVVHQEFNLVPEMSVSENIFLGREYIDSLNKIDWKTMHKRADELCRSFDIDFNVRSKVKSLSVAEQQMVEIVKALSLNAKLIILDEPTAVLTDKETDQLFGLIRKLKSEGKTVIYISHRLDELKHICDDITILRDGKHIYSGRLQDRTKNEIVQMMVARKMTQQYPTIQVERGKEILKVVNFSSRKKFSNISFSAYAGEILGFFGLVGSGRTELMRCILAADKKIAGSIFIENQYMNLKTPNDALNSGIVYITESRKELGLLLSMPVVFNATLSSLENYLNKLKGINIKKEEATTAEMVQKLNIKITDIYQEIRKLSGGNQQKVLLARSMLTKPKLIIFDEPTRGVDVGAKVGIYEILNNLKREGVAIIIISSDMPEVLGISDRLLVMHCGRVTAEFRKDEFEEALVAHSAFGKYKNTELTINP